MERIEPLHEDCVARRLDLGPAIGVRLVRLDHRRHPIGEGLAADLDLERRLELGHPRLEGPGDRSEVPVEGELVQVAKAVSSSPSASRLASAHPVDGSRSKRASCRS